MRDSPLTLTEYFTTHLAFFATPDFKSADELVPISVEDLDVTIQPFANQEDSFKRALEITIKVKEEIGGKYPYDFTICLIGYFEINRAWESNADVLFTSNAPALLYSAARHAIATATGTGPYRKAILPSVTFVELPKPEGEGSSAANTSERMVKKPVRPKRVPKDNTK